MRVCFVIPPSSFLLDDRVFPSLGVLKIAAVLRADKVPVSVLDLSGNQNYEVEVLKHLDADVYGITATTPQLPAAVNIARILRAKKKKVMLGGPHLTLTNAARKKSVRAQRSFYELLNEFDVLVAGDGEEAIHDALRLGQGFIDADIPKTRLFLTSTVLNELPFPARDLIDLQSYHYDIDGYRTTSLIAQLGCPFRCGFCGGRNSPSLRRIRTRTAENIVAEMVEIYQTYGFRGFMFHDDELNVNKGVVDLMTKIRQAQEKLDVEWRIRGFIKAELLTEEQAEAMYAAGVRKILVGFESGSPRILKNIQKNATQEENTRCYEIATKAGLNVKALMSLGHPAESDETVDETRYWLKHMRPTEYDVTIIAVYPGTNYYDDAVDVGDGWWKYEINGDALYSEEIDCRTIPNYYKGRKGEAVAFVKTDYLSSADLVRRRDELDQEFR